MLLFASPVIPSHRADGERRADAMPHRARQGVRHSIGTHEHFNTIAFTEEGEDH
jgi:hypothetical protein